MSRANEMSAADGNGKRALPIDLRSDTVTKPTPAMRQAMIGAEVGDDVYGEDPTVNRLEARAAELIGKEAALFVPSGTMGNTIGIKIHTRHGEEVVCEEHSHVLDYELAMMGWFAGCLARPVAAEDGVLRWANIEPFVRAPSPHWAPTGLISVENTHNMAGGTVTPIEIFSELCGHARERGLPVHLDGARIFNAAAYLRRPARELAAGADTVMFCLSKGLGAPVGSILAGTNDAIARGRLYRKRLGGGMRQSGVLAAAGLVALEEMTLRLHDDHDNALLLADGLAAIPGIQVDRARVHTNIVFFDVSATGLASGEFAQRMRELGVLAGNVGPRRVRLVTHYDVSTADCVTALAAIQEVARQASVGARNLIK